MLLIVSEKILKTSLFKFSLRNLFVHHKLCPCLGIEISFSHRTRNVTIETYVISTKCPWFSFYMCSSVYSAYNCYILAISKVKENFILLENVCEVKQVLFQLTDCVLAFKMAFYKIILILNVHV